MSKHILSKKDYKEFLTILENFNLDGSTMQNIEVESNKKNEIYYFSGKPVLYNGIPTLYLINYLKVKNHTITVDDGAVPHITNGSNLFAPGITDTDDGINDGDMVFIKNKNGVFIAVGYAEEFFSKKITDKKGDAVRIIHHLNDKIMNSF